MAHLGLTTAKRTALCRACSQLCTNSCSLLLPCCRKTQGRELTAPYFTSVAIYQGKWLMHTGIHCLVSVLSAPFLSITLVQIQRSVCPQLPGKKHLQAWPSLPTWEGGAYLVNEQRMRCRIEDAAKFEPVKALSRGQPLPHQTFSTHSCIILAKH